MLINVDLPPGARSQQHNWFDWLAPARWCVKALSVANFGALFGPPSNLMKLYTWRFGVVSHTNPIFDYAKLATLKTSPGWFLLLDPWLGVDWSVEWHAWDIRCTMNNGAHWDHSICLRRRLSNAAEALGRFLFSISFCDFHLHFIFASFSFYFMSSQVTRSFVHSFIRSFVHSFAPSLTQSAICALILSCHWSHVVLLAF